jgi:hypothetical protein
MARRNRWPSRSHLLPELKYEQTIVGAVKVDVLGPDAGMRTFTARFDSTYKGKPIPSPAFVAAIMVRQEGQLKERFYQVTAVQP